MPFAASQQVNLAPHNHIGVSPCDAAPALPTGQRLGGWTSLQVALGWRRGNIMSEQKPNSALHSRQPTFGSLIGGLGPVLAVRWHVFALLIGAAIVVEAAFLRHPNGPLAKIIPGLGPHMWAFSTAIRLPLDAMFLGMIAHLTLSAPVEVRAATRRAAIDTARAFPALLVIGLLIWAPHGLFLLFGILASEFGATSQSFRSVGALAIMIGGPLQLILAALLLTARAAAVWEQLTPGAAMRRALELTRSRRGEAIRIYMLGCLLLALLQVVAFVWAMVEATENGPTAIALGTNPAWMAAWIGRALAATVFALYYRAIIERLAGTGDPVAAVFD